MRRVALVILASPSRERAAASHSHPRAIFFHRVASKRLRRAAALVFYVSGPMPRAEIEVQVLLGNVWSMLVSVYTS